jgi:hypothetical protein
MDTTETQSETDAELARRIVSGHKVMAGKPNPRKTGAVLDCDRFGAGRDCPDFYHPPKNPKQLSVK